MEERLNTPHTDRIELDFLGHRLQLAQDPNSKHLGTTVWDSSLVFVKFLEQNCKKGEFSHPKLAGKRVIELGAGCGLAGLGMALLGCQLVATDQVEVLPLLIRNLERNMARATHSPSESPFLGSLGTVEVVELNWGDEAQIKALKPPFDYIIGSDIVYKEQLLEPLVATLIGLGGPKTTILLANEYRSSSVHEKMLHLWKESFNMKIIPRSKMDPTYQHEYIQLFSLKLKGLSSSSTNEQSVKGTDDTIQEREDRQSDVFYEKVVMHDGNRHSTELTECAAHENIEVSEAHDSSKSMSVDQTNVDVINCKEGNGHCSETSDWEVRRLGSMAARLLQNVPSTSNTSRV
ncbi:hypothetical protein GOP47_0000670 [Adiantum capillus-veneris]|uniref:Uncharacterized protein n=1 Tax=Adiantum capillus-veneris TaxID=13818 RepID=A0A9D4VF62_ADICA|nr:hypothetical protein GOP47_0000670 [Adiantum capillus-veneris]